MLVFRSDDEYKCRDYDRPRDIAKAFGFAVEEIIRLNEVRSVIKNNKYSYST